MFCSLARTYTRINAGYPGFHFWLCRVVFCSSFVGRVLRFTLPIADCSDLHRCGSKINIRLKLRLVFFSVAVYNLCRSRERTILQKCTELVTGTVVTSSTWLAIMNEGGICPTFGI
jgi:hypothetical protein